MVAFTITSTTLLLCVCIYLSITYFILTKSFFLEQFNLKGPKYYKNHFRINRITQELLDDLPDELNESTYQSPIKNVFNEDYYPLNHPLGHKNTFSLSKTTKDDIPSNNQYSDIYYNPLFSRLDNWPNIRPENLKNYIQILENTSYINNHTRWKDEIAPWVWHYRGSNEDSFKISDNRVKAAIVILVRNSELKNMVYTIKQFEARFNSRYMYPYVFLNDVPFTSKFMNAIAEHTKNNVTFALLPKDHWETPSFVDKKIFDQSRKQLESIGVAYGGLESYRHMCRFYSGFFHKHPVLQDIEYYWRIEPGVDYLCDLNYDPFRFMKDNKKVYAFVISIKEIPTTIPSLWEHTLRFAVQNNITSNFFKFFAGRDSQYNLCHFWSNFEIASFDFLRSTNYENYFNYLDSTKNFFYERWGDAPVHSLAAGLFLNYEDIHFFSDIGYTHDGCTHCTQYNETDKNETPKNLTTPDLDSSGTCPCPPNVQSIDNAPFSCLQRFKTYKPIVWTNKSFSKALNTVITNKRYKSYKMLYIHQDQRRWIDLSL
ncbi:hypothetical protein BB558_003119 [Smittium angustum]|uniref:Uncharacterized protein n=1 Tax=Smittium angustum TaxID=133377 RepID=A0A2U1J718_SMIAN|nr:hypothetical protein BB558_003119 [Smittium angustum]